MVVCTTLFIAVVAIQNMPSSVPESGSIWRAVSKHRCMETFMNKRCQRDTSTSSLDPIVYQGFFELTSSILVSSIIWLFDYNYNLSQPVVSKNGCNLNSKVLFSDWPRWNTGLYSWALWISPFRVLWLNLRRKRVMSYAYRTERDGVAMSKHNLKTTKEQRTFNNDLLWQLNFSSLLVPSKS